MGRVNTFDPKGIERMPRPNQPVTVHNTALSDDLRDSFKRVFLSEDGKRVLAWLNNRIYNRFKLYNRFNPSEALYKVACIELLRDIQEICDYDRK